MRMDALSRLIGNGFQRLGVRSLSDWEVAGDDVCYVMAKMGVLLGASPSNADSPRRGII